MATMRPRRARASQSIGGRRGAALMLTFLMMMVLSGLALGVGVFAHNSLVAGKTYLMDQQAFYIAEAGLERARQQLEAENWTGAASPGNEFTESFGGGEYVVTIVDNGSDLFTVTSEAYIPNEASAVAERQVIEANLEFSPGSTNLSLAATAAASSSQGASTPDKGNDGSTSTSWKAGTQGSGEWLRMDYGSATSLSQVVIKEDSEITGVTIESSDDASSWTTVPGLTGDGDDTDTTWTMDFTAISKRFFRAVFTASGSNKRVSVQEDESFGAAPPPTIQNAGEFTTAW